MSRFARTSTSSADPTLRGAKPEGARMVEDGWRDGDPRGTGERLGGGSGSARGAVDALGARGVTEAERTEAAAVGDAGGGAPEGRRTTDDAPSHARRTAERAAKRIRCLEPPRSAPSYPFAGNAAPGHGALGPPRPGSLWQPPRSRWQWSERCPTTCRASPAAKGTTRRDLAPAPTRRPRMREHEAELRDEALGSRRTPCGAR